MVDNHIKRFSGQCCRNLAKPISNLVDQEVNGNTPFLDTCAYSLVHYASWISSTVHYMRYKSTNLKWEKDEVGVDVLYG